MAPDPITPLNLLLLAATPATADLSALAEIPVGGYVSIWKTIPVVLLLLGWTRLLTWIDKDAPAAHLPRIPLNLSFLGGLILAFAMFFLLPGFLIAFPVLLVVFIAEIGTYLVMRHQRVGLGDLKTQFREWREGLTKKKEVKELPNTVSVILKSGAPMAPPNEPEHPDRPGYAAIQEAFTEPLKKGAEQIELGAGATGTIVRYYVDGVPYNGATVAGTGGAGAITILKRAAGLDLNERRKPQRGMVKLAMEGKRREFRIDTLGSTAGEVARLMLDPKKRHDFTIDKMGFTPKHLETLRHLIREDKQGVVLVAAPKGQGLTSMLYALVNAHDAFLEHIHTVEREPDQELTGITQNKLTPNATPAEEAKQVAWVVSQMPDVIMISRVDDPKSAHELIDFAKEENKRVYVGLRAGTTFEALSQWRKLVGDDRLALSQLRLVIAGRVLRKLCNACKVGYSPDPGTLKQIGMDPAKVTQLFQARSQPLVDPKGRPVPCEFCLDLRFKGRTGVYEVMSVEDDIKKTVLAGGNDSQVRAAFRKQRGRLLTEEALALVERGDTSVKEVQRVLKGGGDAPPTEGANSSAAAALAAGAAAAPPTRAAARPTAR